MEMTLDDSRRLTGPNLFTDSPGAVMEVYLNNIDRQAFVYAWRNYLQDLLNAMGMEAEIFHRYFDGGVNIGFTALEDRLYSACEINEAAFELARAEIFKDTANPDTTSMEYLANMIWDESNKDLLALIQASNKAGVTYLVDDDEFSLGMGKTSKTWPIADLPDPQQLDFSQFSDIPVAFITGTNGKSTSVRMADSVAKAAGYDSGITSTDFIRAADEILDKGDYSGPGGARTLIRNNKVELALLEVARGGMLRRGLGVHRAKAAMITNVADDHLGQYGINTVAELTGAKGIVSRSLDKDGTLVLNADDEGLVEYFKKNNHLVRGKLCYFSLNPNNPIVKEALTQNHQVILQNNGNIEICQHDNVEVLMPVNDIPTALNGAAQHNVANAMGVVGLSLGLGISKDAIIKGLGQFKGDVNDNPGRGNYFDINGARFLIDFAHNAHSLTAVVNTVSAQPAKRRLIMLGHAGDRTDRDIFNLTEVALRMKPDMVVIAEIEDYLRGRELGEIPALIKTQCLDAGLSEQQIHIATSCLDGTKFSVDWAQKEDFVLLLALDQRDQIFNYLETKI